MIISELKYHLVIPTNISNYYEPKMKSDLSIIIPEIITAHSGVVEKLKVEPDRVYILFAGSPQYSPEEIAKAIVREGSERLKRLHDKLAGFNLIFREDYYFKTGKKPTRSQVDDFIKIAKEGI